VRRVRRPGTPAAAPPLALVLVLVVILAAGCGLPGGRPAGTPAPAGQEQGAADGGSDAGTPSTGQEPPAPEPSPPAGEPGGPPGFQLVGWLTGLDRPVQVVPVPGGTPGRYLVVEQAGRLLVVDGDAVRDQPALDLRGRIAARGEQGLLSVAFHPRYPEEPWLFASYTDAGGDTRVVRYAMDPEALRVDESGAVTLLSVDQPYANHNGGLILFGPDGLLYLGLGDGGSAGDPLGHGQNPDTLLATVLRLDVDGPLPPDPEVVAYGLRNPWRFSFDRGTGDLYIADVGQNAVEEVNLLPAGSGPLNFGWNAWEGSRRFSRTAPFSDVTFPIAEYTHDGGHCSITGGYVYRGRDIPALDGVYLFADYCSGVLWGLRRGAEGWIMEVLADTDLQPSAFGEDLDGEIFIIDHRGAVYRLEPGDTPVPESLRPAP